jgi:hypothetical protein
MTMTLDVKIEILKDGSAWDAFIDRSPFGELFHKWDFMKVVERHSGYRFYPYGFFEGEKLVCLLPAFFRNQRGLRLLMSPPPLMKLPYLGFVMEPGHEALPEHERLRRLNGIAEGFNEIIRARRPNYTGVQSPTGFSDLRPFLDRGFHSKVNFDYIMDVSPPLKTIEKGFSQECRSWIKQKSSSRIEIREEFDVDKLLGFMRAKIDPVHQPTFPPHLSDYFKDLLSVYPDNLKMLFFYEGDALVSVQLRHHYKDRCFFWIGGAKKGFHEYVEWMMIRMAREDGFRWVINSDAYTRRLTPFKSKFNFSLMTNYELQRSDVVARTAFWSYNHLRSSPLSRQAIAAAR